MLDRIQNLQVKDSWKFWDEPGLPSKEVKSLYTRPRTWVQAMLELDSSHASVRVRGHAR